MSIFESLQNFIRGVTMPPTIEELKEKADTLEKRADDIEERAKYKKRIKAAKARIEKTRSDTR